ncbi:MAG TPA: thiamine pyrophosphate-dependent enzyme [candidate division Zixibacteria bacterium]|nr:thiamine pyrophosphate-dependent enzyme [candidate division Zixibacteria bacterium]
MARAQSRVEKKQPEFGSDVVVDLMKAFDIEYAAFNPGATFRGIHDSIVNYGGNHRPEVIFCNHEEISVALAHGYAKAKGRPMVAIVHNMVGLQHASMAIFNAWIDRVPIIILGGTGPMNTKHRRPRIDWIHTALVQGNQVRDYVKWDDQPYCLADVPDSFIRGYRIATTEPTAPVYINYDADIQEDRVTGAVEIPDVSRYSPPAPMQANPEALRKTARLLVEAQCPIIIADYLGRNPAAVPALIELAELLGAPVVDKGNRYNFPSTHPLDATDGARELLQRADFVLALDVFDLFGSLTTVSKQTRACESILNPAAKIAHISMNDMLVRSWAADYQALQAVDIPMSGDTSVAVPELIRLCRELIGSDGQKKAAIEARARELGEKHRSRRAKWLADARGKSGQKEISTAWLALELGETIKKEDWVLVNGTSNGWARRLWDFNKPNQFLGGSGGAGVGYGMSAAIGAALALKDTGKLAVDIQSDGDLLMTSSSLWTAAKHRIPLLIVMHNNQSYYNSEEHGIEVAKFRGRPVENAGIGTHVDDPAVDFARMAQSFGVAAEGPVRRPEELRPALERGLKYVKEKKLPYLVDVIAEPR